MVSTTAKSPVRGAGKPEGRFKGVADSIIQGSALHKEEKRVTSIKTAIGHLVQEFCEVLGHPVSVGGEELPRVHEYRDRIFMCIAPEVRQNDENKDRVRQTEMHMDFLTKQLERRELFATDQRKKLMKEIMALREQLWRMSHGTDADMMQFTDLQVEHQQTLMRLNEESDSFNDLLQVVFSKSDKEAVDRFKTFASMLKKQKQLEVEGELSKLSRKHILEVKALKSKVEQQQLLLDSAKGDEQRSLEQLTGVLQQTLQESLRSQELRNRRLQRRRAELAEQSAMEAHGQYSSLLRQKAVWEAQAQEAMEECVGAQAEAQNLGFQLESQKKISASLRAQLALHGEVPEDLALDVAPGAEHQQQIELRNTLLDTNTKLRVKEEELAEAMVSLHEQDAKLAELRRALQAKTEELATHELSRDKPQADSTWKKTSVSSISSRARPSPKPAHRLEGSPKGRPRSAQDSDDPFKLPTRASVVSRRSFHAQAQALDEAERGLLHLQQECDTLRRNLIVSENTAMLRKAEIDDLKAQCDDLLSASRRPPVNLLDELASERLKVEIEQMKAMHRKEVRRLTDIIENEDFLGRGPLKGSYEEAANSACQTSDTPVDQELEAAREQLAKYKADADALTGLLEEAIQREKELIQLHEEQTQCLKSADLGPQAVSSEDDGQSKLHVVNLASGTADYTLPTLVATGDTSARPLSGDEAAQGAEATDTSTSKHPPFPMDDEQDSSEDAGKVQSSDTALNPPDSSLTTNGVKIWDLPIQGAQFRPNQAMVVPRPPGTHDVVPTGDTSEQWDGIPFSLLKLNYRHMGLAAHIRYTLENLERRKQAIWMQRNHVWQQVVYHMRGGPAHSNPQSFPRHPANTAHLHYVDMLDLVRAGSATPRQHVHGPGDEEMLMRPACSPPPTTPRCLSPHKRSPTPAGGHSFSRALMLGLRMPDSRAQQNTSPTARQGHPISSSKEARMPSAVLSKPSPDPNPIWQSARSPAPPKAIRAQSAGAVRGHQRARLPPTGMQSRPLSAQMPNGFRPRL